MFLYSLFYVSVPANIYKNLKDLFEGAISISTQEEYKDFFGNLLH